MSSERPTRPSRPDLARAAAQFAALKKDLTKTQWSCLAAIAAETTLGWSVLEHLGATRADLNSWLSDQVVFAKGEVRPLSIVTSGPREMGYELAPLLKQRVLRHTQSVGLLGPVTLRTEALLQTRSQAALIRKVQSGSLIFRTREVESVPEETRIALCHAVLQPFDGKWLTETWKERTGSVVRIVLSTCCAHLWPCDELYEWVLEQPDLLAEPGIPELIISCALHRLEPERVEQLLFAHDGPARQGLLTTRHFMAGQLQLSRQLLSEAENFGASAGFATHPFSPLLAYLYANWGPDDAKAKAAHLWINKKDPDLKGTRKALSTYLKYKDDPEARLVRIFPKANQMDMGPWEILLLGLTVSAFVENETSRTAWSHRLTTWGTRALLDGYLWMGRQGLVLAAALDRAQMARTLSTIVEAATLPITDAGLFVQPGDLAELSALRPAWETRLAALSRISVQISAPTSKYQIKWFVDPVSGSINRPGLMQFEQGRGWNLERRLSFVEARALSADLAPEDARILQLSEVATDHESFPHLQVFEALIGHPRIVDGALGELRVDISRDVCRIETFDEPETLRVGIRPEGLGPGLNLIRHDAGRLSVVHVDERMAAVMEALPQDLVVPHADVARVLTVVGQLGQGVPIKSPHLDGEVQQVADTTPTLRFAPHAGAYLIEAGVQPFGPEGRFFSVGTGPSVLSGIAQGRKRRTTRDFELEELHVSRLIAACPTLLSAPKDERDSKWSWFLNQEGVLQLLAEVKASGLTCHLEWPERNALRLSDSLSIGALRGALRSKKGWYLLSGSIAVDQVTSLTLAQLTRLPYVQGGRFVRLPNGDFAAIDQRVRHVAALVAGSKVDGAGNLQLSAARMLALKSALEGAALTIDPDVEQALAELQSKLHQTPQVPRTLQAELRPYQRDGFTWLYRLGQAGFGACLADDMGLGKTLQIIAFLLSCPEKSRHLVIAPVSVCTNWHRELSRFAPNLSVHAYRGQSSQEVSSAKADVTIASYNQIAEARAEFAEIDWETVVVDEAQYIKNPKTQRAQAVLALRARHRIAATGTPVENHLGDLWGIFRFLNPDLLGKWSAFFTHYVKPIERDRDAGGQEILSRILKPFILRREKSEVLKDLPALSRVRHEVQLTPEEAQRYAFLRRQVHDKLRTPAGKKNNKLEVLAEITRLRRFCCHPRLVFPDAPDDSAKLRALIPLIVELEQNGHHALVFSQYVDFLTSVRERLSESGIDYEYLDGSSSRTDRQKSIDRFATGTVPVFLISLKAGGVGLNLTMADYVIHLDPWWNPAVSAQATDRAHRIGQDRPVTVYEFVTADTIEEDIFKLHESKNNLSTALLEGADEVGALEAQDLQKWLQSSLTERASSGLSLGNQ